MLKKSLLTVSVLGLLGSFGSGAFALVPPKECPKVDKLNKTKFEWVEFSEDDNEYVALNISDYGTNNRWGFIVARIRASSKSSALKLANGSLSTLVGNPAPYQYQGENFWDCAYSIGKGYMAVAVTPVPANNLKRFLHHH